MKKFRFKSIRIQMFALNALVLVLLAVVITLVASIYVSSNINDQKQAEISQVARSISAQTTRVVEAMESVSRQVIYSTSLKSLFYSYVNAPDGDYSKYRYLEQVTDSLTSIFSSAIPQISYISLQSTMGDAVTVGGDTVSYIRSPQELASSPALANAQLKRGRMQLTTPHHGIGHSQMDDSVISMLRFFYDPNQPGFSFDAFVDVQLDYENIGDIVSNVMNDSSQQVLIISQDGNIVYPSPSGGSNRGISIELYYQVMQCQLDGSNSSAMLVNTKYSEGRMAVAYDCSDYSGWTVIVYEPESVYLQPMRQMILALALVSLAVLVLSLLLTWRTAVVVTTPITALRNEVSSIDLATLRQDRNLHFEHHEYEDLQNTFDDMLQHLHSAFEQTMEHKQQELRTRLYVLQSKMDPHFVNNALALIQIFARNEDLASIKEICGHLSGMTRYLYKSYNEFVDLAQEVEYSEHYLKMMQARYPKNLSYTIDVPDELMAIYVPKLIIQPLIENSFKHGMLVSPPWEIVIRGRMLEDERYVIEIQDNGVGFPEQVRKELLSRDLTAPAELEAAQNTIDGIGLINIFTRIRLLYGQQAIFDIVSPPEGGAIVRIGGDIANWRVT